ncbi:cytochrome c550 [Ornithinibacillus salinisoli]|uniref:Cytochrome c550 n=1 Tax=Ornithinibacillus salinisoli TaxID=1848459 RepID=A0ABW4W3M9_9BACI
MRKNPVIPFAIIAIVGILTVIVLSFIGVDQRNNIAGEDGDHGGEAGETVADPDVIYENNCSSCHGADLSGSFGPDLTQVGSNLSPEEISQIIQNGQGEMPPQGQLSEGEVSSLVEWLSDHQ